MKNRLAKTLKKLIYPFAFLLFFFLFFFLFFPYPLLKDKLVHEFNSSMRTASSPQELRIDELEGHLLTGVRAKGVHLISPPGSASKTANDFFLDEVKVRVQVLPFLIFRKNFAFDLSLMGGKVDGVISVRGGEKQLEVEFQGIQIGEVGSLRAVLCGVPLDGQVYGRLDLNLPNDEISKSEGTLNVEIRDLAVGDGKSKPDCNPLIPVLPKLDAGLLKFEGQIKNGTLVAQKVQGAGKDLKMDGDGTVGLKENVGDSSLEINLNMKITDHYIEKNEMTKSLFGAGSPLWFDPKMKAAKKADGSLDFRLLGSFRNIDFVPGAGSIRDSGGKF